MYVPQHFRLPDEHLGSVLGQARVANLVTVHADGPRATLVPVHHELRDGRHVFTTHLVRNNPQVLEPITGPGMVIIDVADAYVAPEWYATNDELPNVPTWDYVTVHATGRVVVDEDPAAALRAAEELTRRMGEPQVMEQVGAQRLERMARAIVAVELHADRIEAKAKMSQNRHPDDVASVADAFEREGHDYLASYLRDVSLPYARARLALIEETRAARA